MIPVCSIQSFWTNATESRFDTPRKVARVAPAGTTAESSSIAQPLAIETTTGEYARVLFHVRVTWSKNRTPNANGRPLRFVRAQTVACIVCPGVTSTALSHTPDDAGAVSALPYQSKPRPAPVCDAAVRVTRSAVSSPRG